MPISIRSVVEDDQQFVVCDLCPDWKSDVMSVLTPPEERARVLGAQARAHAQLHQDQHFADPAHAERRPTHELRFKIALEIGTRLPEVATEVVAALLDGVTAALDLLGEIGMINGVKVETRDHELVELPVPVPADQLPPL